MQRILILLALLAGSPAYAAGTIPIALTQQFSANGQPLSGALLYFYVAGTVNAPQNSYQDFALTIANPWPLRTDATGRIPMFYLADGQVHIRLTDALGVVVFDYPTMQVIGPSSPGTGGPGATIDPTTIAQTGDVKFRMSTQAETLTGWVRLNGTTIGTTGSSATTANSNLQALWTYLYANCTSVAPTNSKCPVSNFSGNAAADFAAFGRMTLPDLRGRMPFGLDDMGGGAAGRLLLGNIVSPGDTPTTPMAVVGQNNHTLQPAELPAISFAATTTITDTRTWGVSAGGGTGGTGFVQASNVGGPTVAVPVTSGSISAATTVTGGGSGTPFNVVANALLGTWWMKI
jgi:hypothetical protein